MREWRDWEFRTFAVGRTNGKDAGQSGLLHAQRVLTQHLLPHKEKNQCNAAGFAEPDEVDGSCSTGVAMRHNAVVMNC